MLRVPVVAWCRESAGRYYRELEAAAMKSAEKKEKLKLGIAHFNAQKFFEAHEVWEEIWLTEAEPEKTFLQGLIQVAAAFHHFKRGNSRGAESLLMAGILKLSRFPAGHLGLAVGELRAAAKEWARLLGERRQVEGARLPRIRWAAVSNSASKRVG